MEAVRGWVWIFSGIAQWKKRKMFFVYLSSKHSEQQTLFKNAILCVKDMISDYMHLYKISITHNTPCQEGMLLGG